jgi:hypothetical protein
MAAHTPGPWEASRWRVCYGVLPGQRIGVICDVATNKESRTPESEANARLIAAAPDLLAACKAAIEEFRHLGQAMGEMTPPKTVDVWNRVEAAIAKAERKGVSAHGLVRRD